MHDLAIVLAALTIVAGAMMLVDELHAHPEQSTWALCSSIAAIFVGGWVLTLMLVVG